MVMGDDEDDFELGPLLPPEDRVWRHPAEMGTPKPPPAPRRGRGSTTMLAAVGGAVGAGVTVAMLSLAGAFDADPPRETVAAASVPVTQPVPTTEPASNAMLERVISSVARVETVSLTGVTSGSAVIIDANGHLLTNAHVVDGAESVDTYFGDTGPLPTRIVGTDDATDLAVLEVETAELPSPIEIGSTDELVIGDRTFAVGSPLGLSGRPSVSVGVLSGTRPRVESSDGRVLYGLLQTDAPISPGSSGGALVDRDGRLIGITTAFVMADGTPTGLTLAVPAELAQRVGSDIITIGRARHAWMGISGGDDGGEGTRIVEVVPNGPAADADLRTDDVITAIDRTRTASMAALVMALRDKSPGEQIEISYERDGERQRCTVRLTERSAFDQFAVSPPTSVSTPTTVTPPTTPATPDE